MARRQRRRSTGYLCPRGLEVQTLIFPLDSWDERAARAWAKDHGFSVGKVDTTGGSHRFRQVEPREFVRGSFRTIAISDREDIEAVVGCPLAGHKHTLSGVSQSGERDPARRGYYSGRRARRAAVRIPRRERAAVSRRASQLVHEGYSPSYASRVAYHGRDPAKGSDLYEGDYVLSQDQDGRWHVVRDSGVSGRHQEIATHLRSRTAALTAARDDARKRGGKSDRAHVFVSRPDGLIDLGKALKSSRDPRVSAAKRRSLRASQFALPKRKALPIHDKKHVANAASRLAQMHKRGTITESEYRSALRRVRAAERRFGITTSRAPSRSHARERDPEADWHVLDVRTGCICPIGTQRQAESRAHQANRAAGETRLVAQRSGCTTGAPPEERSVVFEAHDRSRRRRRRRRHA